MATKLKRVSNSIRLAIVAPFAFLALGQGMSPSYPTNTRTQRFAEWAILRVAPKDLN